MKQIESGLVAQGASKRPNVSAMLRRIANQLPLLDARRAGSELYGSPRLNAFTLFRPNENALSRVVEDLFDPDGTHGQGIIFLNALLAEIDLPRAAPGDAVRTRREAGTAGGRRIDLVVETPRVLLGLENKPWAGQQPRQLHDYLAALKGWARGRDVALVFLSDQEPETAKDEVIPLPYVSSEEGPSLLSVLETALDGVKAPRARAHVEEFISYMDWQFGDGGMIEDSDLQYVEAVEAEFTVPEHRRAVAAVLLSSRALHERVLNEIGASLFDALDEVADDFEVVDGTAFSEALAAKECSWEVRRPSWPANLSVAVEAGKTSFGDVYYGVRAPDPKDREAKAEGVGCVARREVEAALKPFAGGGKTKWWPWWRYAVTRQWSQEFAATVVLHSPSGRVSDHPEVAELSRLLVELATAVDEAISAN